MPEKDISHLIERLEAFEDHLGVGLESLYASIDTEDDRFKVLGEVHPSEGATLNHDLEIVVALYNNSGQVIDLNDSLIRADRFFGFEAFSVGFYDMQEAQVAKIRVYPKLW